MTEAAILELVVLCSSAAGLVLLGICRLFLSNGSAALRVSAAIGSCLLPAAGPLVAGFSTAAVVPALSTSVVAIALAVLGSTTASARLFAGLRHFGRPEIQAAALSAIGGALLIGSLVRFDEADAESFDRDLQFMQEVTWKPPLTKATGPLVATDKGRTIALWDATIIRPQQDVMAAEHHALSDMGFSERLIRTSPATEVTNCHGWVFAAGEYWVAPEDVDFILADNEYATVSQPRPGDVVIYRESDKVLHSGIVRNVMENGPVLVESKWGWMGTFIHPLNGTVYGQTVTFYRSPRNGHTLAGLDRKSKTQQIAADTHRD